MSQVLNQNSSLRDAAPGFYAQAGRLLGASKLVALEAAYALSCAHSGLSESGVMRSDGASFNPRPARVAQIVLGESLLRDPDTIAAAILACSEIESSALQDSTLSRAWQLALQARRCASAPHDAPAETQAIALALILDKTRHLHMQKLQPQQLSSQIIDLTLRLSKFPQLQENAKLRSLVESALLRLKKFNPQAA